MDLNYFEISGLNDSENFAGGRSLPAIWPSVGRCRPAHLSKKNSETAVKCRFREVALRHCVCGICVKNSEISAYRGRRECGECEKMPNNEDEPFSRHPHYLHELPFEDEERLGKLFTQLDKDGNGKIDILDLSQALKEHGVHHHYAEVRLRVAALSGL
jgi:hypothetical protein